MSLADFSDITTDKPEKSLLRPKKSTGGRNNQGRLTVRHKGGGHKKPIASLISNATSMTFPVSSQPLNTIPTATAASPWCNMPTVRSATSFHPSALRSATK